MTRIILTTVDLIVSDPWDFVTDCGAGPFSAVIVDEGQLKVLIELRQPFTRKGVLFVSAVCQRRHVGKNIDDILAGHVVPVNIAFVEARIQSLEDLTPANWQDATRCIGMIERA